MSESEFFECDRCGKSVPYYKLEQLQNFDSDRYFAICPRCWGEFLRDFMRIERYQNFDLNFWEENRCRIPISQSDSSVMNADMRIGSNRRSSTSGGVLLSAWNHWLYSKRKDAGGSSARATATVPNAQREEGGMNMTENTMLEIGLKCECCWSLATFRGWYKKEDGSLNDLYDELWQMARDKGWGYAKNGDILCPRCLCDFIGDGAKE